MKSLKVKILAILAAVGAILASIFGLTSWWRRRRSTELLTSAADLAIRELAEYRQNDLDSEIVRRLEDNARVTAVAQKKLASEVINDSDPSVVFNSLDSAPPRRRAPED